MSVRYVVVQGDYLAKIAREHGLTDYLALWNAPENAALRAKRKSPNVLFPGDVVVIPEAAPKQESGSTEQRHRFVLERPPLGLRIAVEDAFRAPIRNTDLDLELDGRRERVRTDGEGAFELAIAPTTERGRLVLPQGDSAFAGAPLDVQVGALDPIDTIEGQSKRLVNLGYLIEVATHRDEPAFLSAVQEFQCDHGLAVDGRCGPATQAKLAEVHGS